MERTAFIFPGQGAQLVGMGADVAAKCQRADDVYRRANDVLGFDLRAACFEGPAEALEATDVQQPAILVTSIALLEALAENCDVAQLASATAGLSLGEYTALYFAKSLTFEDAVTLVRRRGALMQEAADAFPGGMVSLIGADEEKAQALCAQVSQGEAIVPANLNCPGQVVVSGTSDACLRAAEQAEEFGLRAVPLKVAGAFHSPLMQPAADRLGEVLADTKINAPRIPVMSNVTGKPHAGPDEIRELLQKQVTHAVRWQSCVEQLLADGVSRFVEVGPNRVLTGMMRKIDRKATAISISTQESIEKQELAATADTA
ncbi:MAG: ACP S-malonyltransferase [Phycisphaerales bacterium]|nr:ACP S-malonyltransferase [Phycisphaerales bacterium]